MFRRVLGVVALIALSFSVLPDAASSATQQVIDDLWVTDLHNATDAARGSAPIVLDDGSLLVTTLGGTFNEGKARLIKLNADGSTDTSFGNGGSLIAYPDRIVDTFNVEVQADGKILVNTRYFRHYLPTLGKFIVATERYNANGRIDTTFGTNGLAETTFYRSTNYSKVIVLPDGKIETITSLKSGDRERATAFAFTRLNSDGTPDATFGEDGTKIWEDGTTQLCDGNFAHGLDNDVYFGCGNALGLSHLYLDGRVDTSFGDNGIAFISPLRLDVGGVSDIIVQPDGKIVVTGTSDEAPFALSSINYAGAIARYLPSGDLDPTFGAKGRQAGLIRSGLGGVQLVDDQFCGYPASNNFLASVLQDDGKILVAGDLTGCQGMMRFLADGTPDPTFGLDGVALFDTSGFRNTSMVPWELAASADGNTFYVSSFEVNGAEGRLTAYAKTELEQSRVQPTMPIPGGPTTTIPTTPTTQAPDPGPSPAPILLDTTLGGSGTGNYTVLKSNGAGTGYGASGGVTTAPRALNAPVLGGASTPGGKGFWSVGADGGIITAGDAQFYGSTGNMRLNRPVVGMASTPSGKGYWLVAGDGGIFTFGDASFHGSTGAMRLNAPIIGMTSTPSGNGYWLVAADGGIFTFGDAKFFGSTGNMKLNSPVLSMASTPSGNGYWMVGADGGIFTFGDADFYGSTGGSKLNQPVVGMAATSSGKGYWLIGRDGGVFTFGDAAYLGANVTGPANTVAIISGR